MVDAGGSSSRYYRCAAATSGGACSNTERVGEDVLVASAVTELKRLLLDTELRDQLKERIEAKLLSFRSRSGADRANLAKELIRVGAEKERLVAFIRTTDTSSSPGAFEAVRADLERVANREREVQAKLAALSAASEPALPTVAEIMTYVVDVEARIKDDPTTAREALRQVLINGKITLTPQADGSWQAMSMLIVGRLAWKTRKPRSGGPSGASSMTSTTEVVEIGSCAGRI